MSPGAQTQASTSWRPPPPASGPPPAPPSKPMSTLTALAIAGGIVAVVAGVALVVVRPAGGFTARGSVILDRACATFGTDDGDVRDGAQITVRSDGQVVALGRLRE